MRIALLGATGRTGTEFMTRALAQGHEVVAYVRRPEALEARPGLTVVGGQLDDAATLTRAMTGCDAVAVTLGPKVSRPNEPIMQAAIPSVITAAQAAGTSRVVVLSALGAGSTLANTRYPYKLVARTFLAGNFRDHVAGESQLENSGLTWTTIHPGPLIGAPADTAPRLVDAATGRRLPGFSHNSREDVADAMLTALEDPSTFGKKMLIPSHN
jgi:uncharacterized protein YbjT (DUF2867 family)